jgi:hypothetical protein
VPSWGFEFFSLGVPAVFLREGYAGNVTSCRVIVQITSFLSSVRGLELQLFDGAHGLSCSHRGKCWISAHCGRQASYYLQSSGDCHSVEELGFQLLDRRDGTFLQGGRGFPAVRHSGECWAFVHPKRQSFWCHSLHRFQLSSPEWGV